MAEAFKNIKQEFGPDAVILSAKTIQKESGFSAGGKPSMVEVLAANDSYVPPPNPAMGRKHVINQYMDKENSISEPEKEESLKTGMFKGISTKFNSLKAFRIAKNNPHNQSLEDLKELKAYKSLLVSKGIENEIAREIVERTHEVKTTEGARVKGEPADYLPRILEEMGIRCNKPENFSNRRSIVSLVGLTGVGKTTTLAKMAAIQVLELNRSVGVISLDNFRVNANSLLKVYAHIIGFPIHCASTLRETKDGMKSFQDKDVILIDTPGIGLKDHPLRYHTKELLDKLNPDETHLLMHANVNPVDAGEIARNFKLFEFNRLLFTKTDETSSCGIIVNQLLETGKPLSYITTGQNVPEDISAINFTELADLVIAPAPADSPSKNGESKVRDILPNWSFLNASFN